VGVLREIEHRERQELATNRLSDAVERQPGVDAGLGQPGSPDVTPSVGLLALLGLQHPALDELLDERGLDVRPLADLRFGQVSHGGPMMPDLLAGR
jgi:hypothetical protein